jgi:hypothetical protein
MCAIHAGDRAIVALVFGVGGRQVALHIEGQHAPVLGAERLARIHAPHAPDDAAVERHQLARALPASRGATGDESPRQSGSMAAGGLQAGANHRDLGPVE